MSLAMLVSTGATPVCAQDYSAIIAQTDRTEAGRVTDKRRDPVNLLAFTGPKAGWTVIAWPVPLVRQARSMGRVGARIPRRIVAGSSLAGCLALSIGPNMPEGSPRRCLNGRMPSIPSPSLWKPMPHKFNESRRHKFPKARYRVTNWPEYDAALVRRGKLDDVDHRGCRGSMARASHGSTRRPAGLFGVSHRDRSHASSGVPPASNRRPAAVDRQCASDRSRDPRSYDPEPPEWRWRLTYSAEDGRWWRTNPSACR